MKSVEFSIIVETDPNHESSGGRGVIIKLAPSPRPFFVLLIQRKNLDVDLPLTYHIPSCSPPLSFLLGYMSYWALEDVIERLQEKGGGLNYKLPLCLFI